MTTIIGILIVVLLIACVAYLFMVYNRLIQVKHNVDKAWGNIDVLLKQRHDELPKLIETCKQYRDFESTTLQAVIKARAKTYSAREAKDIPALNTANAELGRGLGRLFALAEAYPDLKTNQQFLQLQQRISGLENALSDRRELYNEAVNINNVRMEQFPDLLIAPMAGLENRDLFEVTKEETEDVDIKDLFAA